MCGINCIYDPYKILKNKDHLIARMDQQMVYRGPDSEGCYIDDEIALGMRRLSIIDLKNGDQPLYNEDNSIVLICNGEIYNYIELTRDLKKLGHIFKTGSDSETIIHLYEEYGLKCLDFLRGMFAFVLWDLKSNMVLAARDRVGIKPLYWMKNQDCLWISSELKSIIKVSHIKPSLRAETIYQYLVYGYAIDQRNTMIEEVKRILPGEYLLANKDGVQFIHYWQPKFGGEIGLLELSDEEIAATLEESVSLHLRSDVPVGILLSSGIDSSLIASISRRYGSNYTALCAGYTGRKKVDESPFAHRIANSIGMPYLDVIIDEKDYLSYFEELVMCVDEPIGDLSSMAQWALYKRGREANYKVLLSGIGGDEIFFGYPFWNKIGIEALCKRDEEWKNWGGINASDWVQKSRSVVDEVAQSFLCEAGFESNHPLYDLRDLAPWGPDAMASVIFGTYLVHNGCFLTDKLSMGCSIEARVPLLDHLLIENVIGLPLNRRFDTVQSKVLLRKISGKYLPAWVLGLPKRGFRTPIEFLANIISNKQNVILDGLLAKQYLKKETLSNLVRQQLTLPWMKSVRIREILKINNSMNIPYCVLFFELWYQNLISE